MTRDEILAMKPGRELDALVAEKVFGLQIHWEQTEWSDPYPVDERGIIVDHFSEGIQESFEVMEKMQREGWDFTLNAHHFMQRKNFEVIFGTCYSARATTAPEAICKAALLAVMGEC